MNDKDPAEREEQIRAGLWEQANEALLRIEDEKLREYVAQQLHQPGQNRAVGDVDSAGNPDSFTLRIEVQVPDGWMMVTPGWMTITRFRPTDIGLTAEEVAKEIQLVRWQSGVDIPDDASGLTDPPS
jgi:hypothetical protein